MRWQIPDDDEMQQLVMACGVEPAMNYLRVQRVVNGGLLMAGYMLGRSSAGHSPWYLGTKPYVLVFTENAVLLVAIKDWNARNTRTIADAAVRIPRIAVQKMQVTEDEEAFNIGFAADNTEYAFIADLTPSPRGMYNQDNLVALFASDFLGYWDPVANPVPRDETEITFQQMQDQIIGKRPETLTEKYVREMNEHSENTHNHAAK